MIDVIIVAENAHDTIHKSLLSILLQRVYKMVKIYIIDNNSNEPYDYLIKDFNDLDITIKRLDKKVTMGEAYNIGLDISHEDYVMFLEPTGMFTNEYSLRCAYNNMEDNDLVIGILESELLENSLLVKRSNDKVETIYGNLYKRSVIAKNNLRFPDVNEYEDKVFHEEYIYTDPRIEFINEYVYLRRIKPITIINNRLENEVKNSLFSINKCIENDLNKSIMINRLSNKLLDYFYDYNRNKSSDLIKTIKPLLNVFNDYQQYLDKDEFIDNYYKKGKNNKSIPTISWEEFIKL